MKRGLFEIGAPDLRASSAPLSVEVDRQRLAPPGEFAVANALPENEITMFNSGHMKSLESDLEKAKFQARVRAWFEVAPFSEA